MGATASHRVVVIGAGSIGERHLRCFLASGRCEVSFVEIQEALRSTIESRYGVRGFSELDGALAIRPTSAVICTPAHMHVELATRLTELGMHVLIEKPLGTSLEGVAGLRE